MYDEDTTEAHERRITRCKTPGCNARIIFLLVESTGAKMPVDADTVEPEDEVYDVKRHTSHFAKCPGASSHRRRDRRPY